MIALFDDQAPQRGRGIGVGLEPGVDGFEAVGRGNNPTTMRRAISMLRLVHVSQSTAK